MLTFCTVRHVGFATGSQKPKADLPSVGAYGDGMQLGTIRTERGTAAVRVDGDQLVVLDYEDVGALLRAGAIDVVSAIDGPRVPRANADWAPAVTNPDKIICVGLNYADHIAEMGNTPPEFPTCFSKFSGSLIGAHDDLHLPPAEVSIQNDWEAELCIVIGAAGRAIAPEDALDHVAGYTAFNDFSVRDWQKRTSQFLLGKTFEKASALGPVMTTTSVLGAADGLAISSFVNGAVKQSSNTEHLVFGVVDLISELSKAITLVPGDVIATGTPGGVGAARTPPEWLSNGDELVIAIEGIGEIRNRCVGGL